MDYKSHDESPFSSNCAAFESSSLSALADTLKYEFMKENLQHSKLQLLKDKKVGN